ncbi:MAG: hypothetical protein A2W28_12795 [Gammaproteobacteria bacterium RBG_16_51_14]|nr:MAG: hypothetical protein A2W28_12795 [Gammaproteobacteria bacterium RBG_16_51_14]
MECRQGYPETSPPPLGNLYEYFVWSALNIPSGKASSGTPCLKISRAANGAAYNHPRLHGYNPQRV